jgi:MFS family permease
LPSPIITLGVLVAGLSLLLIGVGLIGTLVGVRASLEDFSVLTIGLIMAGYYLGYVLGTFVVPVLIRRVGHIRTFSAMAAVACVSTLAFSLWINPWVWALLRIAGGVGVVGLYMVVESWLNEQVESAWRGRVFGLYVMSTLGALAAGQFLLLAGDPMTSTLFAVAAIFIALGLIPIAVTRVREPVPVETPESHLAELYRISPMAFQGVLITGLVTSAFWGMGAVFAQRIGLDALGIASFLAATIAGGAALQWPVGHLSDRHDRRKVLIGVSFACALVAFAALWLLQQGLWVMMATAFVYGGLLFPLYGLSVAHANDQLAPGQMLEASRGLLLVYGIGAILGPAVAGVVMTLAGPLGLPLMSGGCLTLLGAFGLYRMTRRTGPPVEEQGEFVPLVRTTPVALEMHPQVDVDEQLSSRQ